jgi:hypothetical protein
MTGNVVQCPPREPRVGPGGYELLARDMTATFSADCTLRFAQQKLAEIDQWLPVDGNPDENLSALIERNSTGPLRLGYGAWRDLLLGIQFTNGKGELITAGGLAVKNVAGYDLTKFMVGQHGVFGRVLTLTARTYRKPDAALLVRFIPDPAILASMLPTSLKPQWSMLTRGELLCGYLGDETTLAWYEQNVGERKPVDVQRRSLDEDTAHRTTLCKTSGGPTAFRASVPPNRVKQFTDSIKTTDWTADPAFGVVIGSADDKDDLKSLAQSLGGSAKFGSSAADLDVSTNPAERQIIERLKAAFDPDDKLEPLPWHRSR